MKIRMLATADGANDGFTVKSYKEGHVGEVSEDLGRAFISAGVAEEYSEPVETAPTADTDAVTTAKPKAKGKKG